MVSCVQKTTVNFSPVSDETDTESEEENDDEHAHKAFISASDSKEIVLSPKELSHNQLTLNQNRT